MHGTLPGITHAREEHPGAHRLTKRGSTRAWRSACIVPSVLASPPLNRDTRPGTFLEERFGITMGDAGLLPENFASVNTICAYLRARQPGKHETAHG